MQHRYCFEAVSRTLNDICMLDDNDDSDPRVLFGNIPILLGGDFAQILPVVRRGNRTTTVNACLQSSNLWKHFKLLTLKKNMRVREGENNSAFAQWLVKISYDSAMYGQIPLPDYVTQFQQENELINFVYPPAVMAGVAENHAVFADRCILAFHNDTVNKFNERVLQGMTGQLHTFHAVDSCDVNEADLDFAQLPSEYLQSLSPDGLPLSKSQLKEGAPVILL